MNVGMKCVASRGVNAGRRSVFVAAMLAAGLVSGAVRTVEMTGYDAATHAVTLKIGAGDGTKSDVKYLFAAYDAADQGDAPADWTNVSYVRTVYASTQPETLTWTLPAEWRTDAGVLRFFLAAPDGPRKQNGFYLASYGIGSGANAPTNHPGGVSFLQWIDTGIPVNSDVSITIETAVASTAGTAPFGAAYKFFCFANNVSTYYSFGHSTMPTTAKYNPAGDDGVHQIRLGTEGFFIDGVRIADAESDAKFDATFQEAKNIWLFGRNRTDVDTTITEATTDKQVKDMVDNLKLGWCRIWSAQIMTNGVPARSFTPRKVGDVPVMWDSVTETAFYNAGGDHGFIYESQSVKLSDGVLETCSPAYVLAPEIEMSGIDGGTVTLTVRGNGRSGALYAVRGDEDPGAEADPSKWDEAIAIGVIPAGATSFTATLPSSWWKAGGYVRFLVAGNAVYDFELDSLSSTGKGDYEAEKNNGPLDQGYQYIDTGIVPDTNTTTLLRFRMPQNMNMAAFGHSGRYYLIFNNRTMWGGFSKNNSLTVARADHPDLALSNGEEHVLQLGPDGGFLDGVDWWTKIKGTAPGAGVVAMDLEFTMTLFARREWRNDVVKFGACTIYEARIKVGDKLVRDYVPVVKDNVGYLYDKVTKKLFGNANTSFGTAGTGEGPAPFVLGEKKVNLSAGDVLAVSGYLALDRGTCVIVR